MCARRARKRRLVRTVRLVAFDIAVAPSLQQRSITEGCKSTSGSSSRPTASPKAARREVANKKALARFWSLGQPAAVIVFAQQSAAEETRCEENRSIVAATASDTVQ